MIDHAGQLNVLIGKKLNELESTLALNERNGREAAFQLIDTGLGQRLMDEIRAPGAEHPRRAARVVARAAARAGRRTSSSAASAC